MPVKRLDDLQLDDVGLIKIDVEGHELAVLLRRRRHTRAQPTSALWWKPKNAITPTPSAQSPSC